MFDANLVQSFFFRLKIGYIKVISLLSVAVHVSRLHYRNTLYSVIARKNIAARLITGTKRFITLSLCLTSYSLLDMVLILFVLSQSSRYLDRALLVTPRSWSVIKGDKIFCYRSSHIVEIRHATLLLYLKYFCKSFWKWFDLCVYFHFIVFIFFHLLSRPSDIMTRPKKRAKHNY